MDFTIELINSPVDLDTLHKICERGFGNMVKGVVDVEKRIVALGSEMHVDEEQYLLELGSQQKDLWGINIRPALTFPESVEFDSMINLRPRQGNHTRSIEDADTRKLIIEIIQELIYPNHVR
jgi:hypothetical protein